MRRTLAIAALLSCAALLQGCGSGDAPKPGPPKTPARPTTPKPPTRAAPSTRPPRPKPATKRQPPKPATPAAAPEPLPEDFGEALAQVLALEQDARFFDAMKLCRELRDHFRTHPKARELDALAARLRHEKRDAAALAHAVKKLASDRPGVLEVARGELLDAGPLGAIFLRKAVREGPDKIATEAAALLARRPDPRTPPVLVARLAKDPPRPLRTALCQSLDALRDLIARRELATLHALVRDDSSFSQRDVVGVLCGVLERRCGSDGAKFDELLGIPDAHALLKAYVEKATASPDEKLVAWAVGAAPRVGWVHWGLRGSYHEGTDFEKLAFERLDRVVHFSQDTINFPTGRKENYSVRWTGFVRAPRPGRYTFYSESDDGHRLWIDGKKLIDDWSTHGAQEEQATIELQPGWHAVKIEHYNGGGEALIKFSWSGPGLAKRLLEGNHLRTPPWKGMK